MQQKSHEMTSAEKSAISKISIRLVPFIALMFFINFLDRTAISFAGPNGMTADLALTAAQFGFAAGIFFVGYIILEVPSNLALHKFGARKWLARIMVTWGIVALLFTWVSSATELYILRFLLGVAEAGFFRCNSVPVDLGAFASPQQDPALFYLAQPLTTVIGAPLAAELIAMHGAFGLEGWRIMFFGVAVPAIVVGIITFFYLPDTPNDAKWLNKEERDWLNGALAQEEKIKEKAHGSHKTGLALADKRVWLLSIVYFGLIYGLYALAFFLPTIIGGFEQQFDTKFDVFDKGLITAIPYLPAAIALYFWSRDAAKRGVRPWHIGIPALVGAIAIPAALFMPTPATTILMITVTACAIFSALPNFWAIPSRFLSGTAAAAGIALINTIGNIAGFAAPYITGLVKDWTGLYEMPMFIVGAVMLVSSLLAFS
ncbi:MFS transporter [Ochrobactrum pseudogrignonense]|nr:MFS transporter [Brucella pseudogrignonensis]